jgi:hypothetical protein
VRVADDGESGFDTPEEAALKGWSSVSKPRVITRLQASEVSVWIIVDTEPSHPMRVRCARVDGRWFWTEDATA